MTQLLFANHTIMCTSIPEILMTVPYQSAKSILNPLVASCGWFPGYTQPCFTLHLMYISGDNTYSVLISCFIPIQISYQAYMYLLSMASFSMGFNNLLVFDYVESLSIVNELYLGSIYNSLTLCVSQTLF